MRDQLPALVFLVPLVAAISMPLVGHFRARLCRPVTLGAVALTALLSLLTAVSVASQGEIRYALGGWAPPVGIEWVADAASSAMVAVIGLLSWICLACFGALADGSRKGREAPYHSMALLLVSGLVGAAYAGDLFNIFVFLEVVALAGYTLVALAGGRALVAAFRYLVIGSLGTAFYLLGVVYFYAVTGSLNIADIAGRMPGLLENKAVIGGLIFMFAGLAIKMAHIPLHGWLPDAYSEAPESAAPLLAGLLTKLSLFVWVRILYWMMPAEVAGGPIDAFALVTGLGILTSVGGAALALRQREIKRMFAYGGIAHVGLVLVGAGQATGSGLAGGLFYLLNDGVMQAALFAFAGLLAWQHGARSLDDLSRLGALDRWMLGMLVIVAVGMVGLPPTGGFFGKWYILLAALDTGNGWAVAAVILTTLLTLAYFAKLFERLVRGGESGAGVEPVEAPWPLRIGAGALAALVLGLGIWSERVFTMLQSATSGVRP